MNQGKGEHGLNGAYFSPRMIVVDHAESIAELEAKRCKWKHREIGQRRKSDAPPQNLPRS